MSYLPSENIHDSIKETDLIRVDITTRAVHIRVIRKKRRQVDTRWDRDIPTRITRNNFMSFITILTFDSETNGLWKNIWFCGS